MIGEFHFTEISSKLCQSYLVLGFFLWIDSMGVADFLFFFFGGGVNRTGFLSVINPGQSAVATDLLITWVLTWQFIQFLQSMGMVSFVCTLFFLLAGLIFWHLPGGPTTIFMLDISTTPIIKMVWAFESTFFFFACWSSFAYIFMVSKFLTIITP